MRQRQAEISRWKWNWNMMNEVTVLDEDTKEKLREALLRDKKEHTDKNKTEGRESK